MSTTTTTDTTYNDPYANVYAIDDAVQTQISNIEQDYIQAAEDIDDINEDTQTILECDERIEEDQDYLDTHSQAPQYNDDRKEKAADLEDAESEKATAEADLEAKEADLASIDGSTEMADLIQSLNDLLDDASHLIKSANGSDISQEMSDIYKYMDTITESMKTQASIDEDEEIIEECGDEMTTSELESYALDLSTQQATQLGILGGLESELTDDIVTYNKMYDDAYENSKEYDKTTLTWSCGMDDGNYHKENDKQVMKNAKEMLDLITNLFSNITEVYSSLGSSCYTSLAVTFKSVMNQIDAILADTSLSAGEQKSQIMALVVFLLSYLDITKQTAESAKAQNEKNMSDASIASTEVSLNEQQTNIRVSEMLQEEADLLKKIQIATTVLMCVLMVAMAPTGPMMIAMMAVSMVQILTVTDVIDPASQLQDALGISKQDADGLLTAMEVLVMLGSGMIIEGAIEYAAESGAEKAGQGAVDANMEAINVAAENAAASAGRAGDETAINSAKELITQAVRESAESAYRLSYKQFFNQSATVISSQITKGTLTTTAKQTSMEAGTAAIEESEILAEQAARGETVQQSAINTLSDSISKEAVARDYQMSIEALEKQETQSMLSSLGTKTLVYGTMAGASNNAMVDFAQWIYEMSGRSKHDSLWKDNLAYVAELLQALLSMGILMGASGSSCLQRGAVDSLGKIASIAQLSNTAVQGAASLDKSAVTKAQADVTVQSADSNIVINFLQDYMDQMTEDFSTERDSVLDEVQKSMQLTRNLANHTQDANAVAAQVMSSMAV